MRFKMPTLFDIWRCVASGYQSKMSGCETNVKPCSPAADYVLHNTTAFHLCYCWPVFIMLYTFSRRVRHFIITFGWSTGVRFGEMPHNIGRK